MFPESVRATPVRISETIFVSISEGFCPFTSAQNHREADAHVSYLARNADLNA
jgi:hypothetical protein